ncbi:flagellin FliC [Halomonas sp. DP8Y7-3]|uniref:flagellin N-terminal helical domain-containing protein n=1 Tax=Halomonas sp. DP8Y7-3 TaxID=2859079 RepID=UPI001C9444A0|nr:flagellin [Halomonas sp. DP8Y7-3]MBY5928711.1 flagellin FliC [Halomonas sp. DP8Y7-3]
MSVINTNITSMIGQQNLNASKSALTTSMERLSSGLRINSAKDDAAGQAIANRMSSQITGLAQAQRNANDGISVAQTAEGALNQVNDNLQRIRELSVQAQNDTNSENDLQSIQDEIGQRLDEIDRISGETNFNGVKVLSEDQGIKIQVGANDNEQITVNLQEINARTLGLESFDVTNAMTTEPDLNLGDAIATVGVESQTSIAGETAVTDFSRTISLNSANIASGVNGTNVGDGDFSDFVTDDTGAVYAKYDNSTDPVEYFKVDASNIDSNGNIDLTSATSVAVGSLGGGAESSTGETSIDLTITPNSGGFTAPSGESFASFAENSSGDLFVKTDAGNFYALDKADVANDGTFTLDASASSPVAIQNASDGSSISGNLREILDDEGNGTGDYVVEQQDGTLLAVESFDSDLSSGTAGQVTIQEVSYTDADGNPQVQLAQAGGQDGTTSFVEVEGEAYLASDIQGLNLQADPDALDSITPAEPLAQLDQALSQVDTLRSELGAVQNRFESAITNLSTNETNLSAARSRIEDADYAVEVANMTRAQILQQAGTSVLAQANQIPQGVLSLLG